MSQPTAPIERLLYLYLSTIGETASRIDEQYINDKISANNKFIYNINFIKYIRNYHETENNNYNKELSRYENDINVAEITEILLSSIATTATTISVAIKRIGLPLSIPTAFAVATV